MKKYYYASPSWFEARWKWLSVLMFKLAYPTFANHGVLPSAPLYIVEWEEYDGGA